MLFGRHPSPRTDNNKKNPPQNPKILEVNLIKGEVKVTYDWNKNLSVILIVVIIVGLLVAEVYYGLDWWGTQELANTQLLNDKVAALNQQITQIKSQTDAAVTYQAKTAAVGKLLANHIYWTNFFKWIEKDTLSSIKYGNFQGDLSGTYNLAATANNYAEVSWQTKAFLNDPLVKKVQVLSANAATSKDKNNPITGVGFNIALQIDTNIFKK